MANIIKDRFLVFLFAMLIQGCSCQNTTDAQISQSSKESKNNGFFIKNFVFVSSTDPNIIVEDAWLEYIWFNKATNFGKTIKVKGQGCQLCFKLKQTPQLKYKERNFLDWNIRFNSDKSHSVNPNVGMTYGIYNFHFETFDVPDTIELDLISRKDVNSEITDTKVGTLIFKAVNETKKK
jgi:hypothetical protein